MNVTLNPSAAEWNAFCESRPDATLYHDWVWRSVIEGTFGHRPYYLAASDAAGIRGVLPLFCVSSRWLGRSLVSMPFFTYGGVLAESGEASAALLAEAERLGKELGVARIELRQGTEAQLPWQAASPKVTMEIALPASPEQYLGRLSAGRRKKIRQSMRHEWRMEWGGLDLLGDFYSVFATNMRNLGTPVYPSEFFAAQLRALPGQIRTAVLYEGARAVAGGFLSAHRGVLELPWAASLPDSRDRAAPLFLYWSMIERAITEGFSIFDMGRCTRGGGSYDFKTHWAPAERPLHWYYWGPEGATAAAGRQDHGPLRMASAIWKHLPLAVANRLGPHLVKALP